MNQNFIIKKNLFKRDGLLHIAIYGVRTRESSNLMIICIKNYLIN